MERVLDRALGRFWGAGLLVVEAVSNGGFFISEGLGRLSGKCGVFPMCCRVRIGACEMLRRTENVSVRAAAHQGKERGGGGTQSSARSCQLLKMS